MSELPSPIQAAHQLLEHAAQSENPALQQDLRDGAEAIRYLLILLNECADYIESVKEYDEPPRFIKAVRDVLS